MNPRSNIRRALLGSLLPLDKERVYARNFEVPSGGGVGTARAVAHAYSAFATGGKELGLREETLRHLMAPPVAPVHGFRDGALKVDVRFSLGFAKPGPKNPFGHQSSFGHPGFGGSFGFADPGAKIGYGYVLNRQGTYFMDPRDIACARQCTVRLARQVYTMIEPRSPTALRQQSRESEWQKLELYQRLN